MSSPISGATVTVAWSGTSGGSQSASTDSGGTANFSSGRTRGGSYCWTATVTDVSISGGSYDSAANVETSDSIGNSCRVAPARLADRGGLHGHPNPFNPTTTISFRMDDPTSVTLKIYDAAGRVVDTLVDGEVLSGPQSIVWNGKGVPSGVYFARLVAGQDVQMQRLVLLK